MIGLLKFCFILIKLVDLTTTLKCYDCDEIRQGNAITGNCSFEALEKADCSDIKMDNQCIYLTMYCEYPF